jgi:hypothetical protein
MALERAAPDSRCKSISHFRPEQFEEPKTLKLSVMGYVGVGAEALFRGRRPQCADGAEAKGLNPSGPFKRSWIPAGSHHTFVRNPRASVSAAGLRGSRSLPGG